MEGDVVVLKNRAALAEEAARRFATACRAAVSARGRFVVALSGGSTPLPVYRRLGEPPYRDDVPWEAVHLVWGDERHVPPSDSESNYGRARAALIDRVPIPASRVHPVPTDLPPEESAAAYSRELEEILGAEPIDLVLLGMGADGHVASIFPGTAAQYSPRRGAVAQWVPGLQSWRVSLTLAEINLARSVVVLVAGSTKAAAVADLRTGASGLPAARVRPAGGLTWLLDRDAASGPGLADLKHVAARAAVDEIQPGMIVGLGTGSTVRCVLDELARDLAAGRLAGVRGIATSDATTARASTLGIPLTTLDQHSRPDLAIDGADEIDGNLDLIKGGGGALLREKIVAKAARRFVVVADFGKKVDLLGTTVPLPIEVVPFGWTTHLEAIGAMGANASLRRTDQGTPYVTDGGHYILDCRFKAGIDDAAAVDIALRRPGVVETGLFLSLAHRVHVASPSGVETTDRA